MNDQDSQPPESTEDALTKELQESRDSGKKAVKDAREAQSKLSISENAKKAEQKKAMEAAQNQWVPYAWMASGAGLLALLIRGWLRRRG